MATRLVLLGSGELGREVAIEAVRLGCEVVAIDSYQHAPAMQVAHRSHVIDMTDRQQLRAAVEAERSLPASRILLVPEIEAIATQELELLEQEGMHVVPTARAARLTMDREGIRRLVAEQLHLPTSPYRFCESLEELKQAVQELGTPCVVKPVMSSSGKGQSVVEVKNQAAEVWQYAQEGARAGGGKVIVEGFVEFDYEITLLTVRHKAGTTFCAPIGHRQEDGDYRESWQPQRMGSSVLKQAQDVAAQVTAALGGYGVFGVELFICGDQVLFSEVSPRPHDTGMVTMASQQLSEFALHVRAILELSLTPGELPLISPAASAVVLADRDLHAPSYRGVEDALSVDEQIELRLFGKPSCHPGRRMGVVLAKGSDSDQALALAKTAASLVTVVG